TLFARQARIINLYTSRTERLEQREAYGERIEQKPARTGGLRPRKKRGRRPARLPPLALRSDRRAAAPAGLLGSLRPRGTGAPAQGRGPGTVRRLAAHPGRAPARPQAPAQAQVEIARQARKQSAAARRRRGETGCQAATAPAGGAGLAAGERFPGRRCCAGFVDRTGQHASGLRPKPLPPSLPPPP